MAGIDPRRWERAQRLARLLLLVGPGGEDLTRRYLDVLFDREPARAAQPRQVLVVGAGIAGLISALLLARRGHRVTIVEANASRVGGRIKTFRSFKDSAQYAEAGAMRLPEFHPMVLALVDDLGLRRRLFYNVDVKPGSGRTGGPVPPVVYKPFDGSGEWRNGPNQDFEPPEKLFRTWIRTNGKQVRRVEYNADPEAINKGFEVPESARKRTANDLVNAALEKVRDYYSVLVDPKSGERVRKPVPEWIEGWARVIYDFDAYSMWGFLSAVAGLDDSTIEAAGTIENLTSRLPLSFFHSFLGRSDINPKATYWEIAGGTDRLTEALKERVLAAGVELAMGQRMIRLEYWHAERDPGRRREVGPDGPQVWVETVAEDDPTKKRAFTAERAIVTIPFSSLRHVLVEPLLSYKKRRAIIELHYDSATKVLLEFSRRWWELTDADWQRELDALGPAPAAGGESGDGDATATPHGGGAIGAHPSVDERQIPGRVAQVYDTYRGSRRAARPADHFFGGGSVTDNPNRFVYYPSHPVPGSPGGVVLASYVWADDAARWDSLDDDERYAFALRGLVALHGERILPFYQGGATQSWLRNPYVFGEAAVFTPWQLTQFHLDIPTVEGPVHFAGEHTSLKHAWIEGAIESAVRAALEVDEAAAAERER
jgi:monoamine oxidase